MNHNNCFIGYTYEIAPDCRIVEIYNTETLEYYVIHPEYDAMARFSFGIPVKKDQPLESQKYSKEDLERLYDNGYFAYEIAMLEKGATL